MIKKTLILLLPIILGNCKCFMSPYTPTNQLYHRSQYFKNYGDQNDSLRFNTFYGIVNSEVIEDTNYLNYNLFCFYPEGIVLNEHFNSKSIIDSIHLKSYHSLVNECHGWTMGCYNVKGDTIRFETTVGYQRYWTHYTAIIQGQSLILLDQTIKGQNVPIKGDSILKNNVIMTKSNIQE